MNRLLAMVVGCVACGGGGSGAGDAGPQRDAGPQHDARADARADAGVAPPIEGGGMRGGSVAGELAVYVVDDIARTPIANATVTIGMVTGATGQDGRFVASGVVGPQPILVTASGHVAQLWIGVAAREATIDLAPDPVVSTMLPSVIVTFPGLLAGNDLARPVASVFALDFASSTADAPIVYPNNNVGTSVHLPRVTDVLGMGPLRSACSVFAWVTSPTDPTPLQVGLALGTTANTFAPLSAIDANTLVSATIDYGTPPAGLTVERGVVGGERPDGILPMASDASLAPTSLKVLPAAAFGGSTYALTARAGDGQTPGESIALRHGLTGLAFAIDAWLDPPANVSASHAAVSWDPLPLAQIVVVEVFDPTSMVGQRSLQIRVFDGSSAVTLPDGIVPAAAQKATVTAIHGDLDLTDLEIDRDRAKIDAISSRTVDLP